MGMNAINLENQRNLWDIEAETLIALLAKRLAIIRKVDAVETTKALNYQFLRKRDDPNEERYNHYSATPFQRDVLNGGGY